MTGAKAMTISVCAFYKFVEIEDCPALQETLEAACEAGRVKGTILLAREGINATISAEPPAMAAFLNMLRSDARFSDLEVKTATAGGHPFQRMKVKLKPEIIAFDREKAGPLGQTGVNVDAKDWNALIADPDVVLVDTRNAYEVAIGTFEGAIDPKTEAFSDFRDYVRENLDPQRDKKVAMFCTGGIRCEKASAHLKSLGFENVYQLEGGILKYLDVVSPEDSAWQGECFVFDERVSVKHGNIPGSHILCDQCGFPLSTQEAEMCPNCKADQER